MSKDAEILHIEKVTGRDGATAMHIQGGKEGQGRTDFFMHVADFEKAEKQGRTHLQETLRRGVETSLEGQNYRD